MGQLPLASGFEPSGHVVCVVDGDAGAILLAPLLPPPLLLSLPPVVVCPPLLPLLLLPPLVLSCFFANAKFTLLPVTKATAGNDDTSVNTRNTRIT